MRLLIFGFYLILQFLIVDSTHAQEVIVSGKWQEGSGYVFLNYYNDAATATSKVLRSAISEGDHSFEFRFQINHPGVINIADQFFIVSPGDTVTIDVKEVGGKQQLDFTGGNSVAHSFLPKLYEVLKPPVYKYVIDKNSIATFKTAATSHFTSSIGFLKNHFIGQNDMAKELHENS